MHGETQPVRVVDSILMEMDQEAETTRRLFKIIPNDKLSWRPHPKAMSLGELALHIATIPGSIAELGRNDTHEVNQIPSPEEATSREQILAAFAQKLEQGKAIVAATSDADAMANWTLTKDGNTLMAMPRIAFWRTILLNHNYHHRGQLSTFLRELDIELPSIYEPSADFNPFA